jgi:hypothetical protein
VQLYDKCGSSHECFYGEYCNEEGYCVSERLEGERCESDTSCGRNGMCIYETTISKYGECVELISQSTSSLVLPEIRTSFSEQVVDSLYYFEEDLAKVCREGYLNVTTGRCSNGLKSLNKVSACFLLLKGDACSSNSDCPTSDSNVFAECKCGHNSKGSKYCDLGGGDDEWTKAFEAVSILLLILSSANISKEAKIATLQKVLGIVKIIHSTNRSNAQK